MKVNSFDDAGNIQKRKEYAYTTGTLGTATATVNYSYGDSDWGDLLTSYNDNAITYDAIGNRKTYNGYTYIWKGRQLTGLSDGTNNYSYAYNTDGIRTSKTVNGTTTTFFLNGTQILAEEKPTGTNWYFYDSTGTRVGMIRDNYVFYYIYNLQGDVVGIMNAATGKIVAKYSYDAWGNCTVTNASGWAIGNNNPFRYRGYYYDVESGFYYLNSRYYDPSMGRFINADVFASTGQGFIGCNMFAYCNNNPVNQVDPSGCFPWWIIPLIIVPLLSGCSNSSSSVPNDYLENNDKMAACYEYAGTYIGLLYSPSGDTDPGTYYARRYRNGVSSLSDVFTINDVSKLVEDDFNALSIDYSKYSSLSQVPKVEDNQKIIACMQYTTTKGYCDYHFSVLLNNGEWADKPGKNKSRHGVLNFDGQIWSDGAGITATVDNTCFFVVTVG